MMSQQQKAQHLLEQIDANRCAGQWSQVKEHALKYTKKHYPGAAGEEMGNIYLEVQTKNEVMEHYLMLLTYLIRVTLTFEIIEKQSDNVLLYGSHSVEVKEVREEDRSLESLCSGEIALNNLVSLNPDNAPYDMDFSDRRYDLSKKLAMTSTSTITNTNNTIVNGHATSSASGSGSSTSSLPRDRSKAWVRRTPITSNGSDIEALLQAAVTATVGKNGPGAGAGTGGSFDYSDQSIHLQASILLARLDLIRGKYNAVIQRLTSLSKPPQSFLGGGSRPSYLVVMYMMYYALLGTAYDIQNSPVKAMEALEEGVKALAAGPPTYPPNKTGHVKTEDDQWLLAAEELLYQMASIYLEAGHLDRAEATLRTYDHNFQHANSNFKPERRITMTRQLILLCLMGGPDPDVLSNATTTMSKLPRVTGGSLIPHYAGPNPLSGILQSPYIAADLPLSSRVAGEMRSLLPSYERLVTHVLPFPKGVGMSDVENVRYERVLEVYDWWVLVEATSEATSGVGTPMGVGGLQQEMIQRHYRLIETLYRGTKHTFQSLKMLRYLSHSFCSLIHLLGDNACREERIEAAAAVEAYVYRFDKAIDLLITAERKKRREARRASAARVAIHVSDPDSVNVDKVNGNGGVDGEVGEEDEYEHEIIPIKDVAGEGIADAVGVLISGARLLLHDFHGDAQAPAKAAAYMDRAVELIKNNEPVFPPETFRPLLLTTLQYHGIVFGEYALDVTSSEERNRLQSAALDSLRKSLSMVRGGSSPSPQGTTDSDEASSKWDLEYQLALQFAEVGEIVSAINTLQDSLIHNPNHVASWNLMALLLSAKKDYDRALDVCEAGWKEGLAAAVAALASSPVAGDVGVPWDLVDNDIKEELFNIKLTQVVIENVKFGPKVALDSLQTLFPLFQRLFGTIFVNRTDTDFPPSLLGLPVSTRPQSETTSTNGFDNRSGVDSPIPSLSHERRHSRVSTGGSSTHYPTSNSNFPTSSAVPASSANSSSVALPGPRYSFRAHDLQICLWLSTAALCRKLEHFDSARAAIEEAEKLVDVWSKLDAKLRDRPTRVCVPAGVDVTLPPGIQEKVAKKKGGATLAQGASTAAAFKKLDEALPKWGLVEPSIRRVIADILFETYLLKEAQYRKLRRPIPKHPYYKYLSPSKQDAADKGASLAGSDELSSRRGSGVTITRSINSILPMSGIPTPMGGGGVGGGSSSSSINILSLSTSQGSVPAVTGKSSSSAVNVGISASASLAGPGFAAIAGTGAGSVPPSPRVLEDRVSADGLGEDAEDEEEKTRREDAKHGGATLSEIIGDFALITLLDDDHLPTRTHLGMLYKEKGDMALAEYWFERACKRSKARGSMGGSRGISTYYGGLTSSLGWESWAGLGRVRLATGRAADAKDCLFFAVEIERATPLRKENKLYLAESRPSNAGTPFIIQNTLQKLEPPKQLVK
ncbi:hypothetical protein HDU76_010382 [Blyttiomyces sp. JEL0837]|nr:hypothetical protein HDU76_010382 [Blyttiomyces sp. JEL0837]